VDRLHVRLFRQVRDGAGDLEDPMVRAGREPEPGEGVLHQGIGLGAHAAARAQVARGHAGVGVEARPPGEPRELSGTRPVHPRPDGGTRLAASFGGQLARGYGRHLDVEVDAGAAEGRACIWQ
jgi:hypothetical protein